MKAAPFDYVRVDHLDGALALLDTHGGDAKLIAGGQSLVPMMAMRLARPALLVDIHRLTDLQGITRNLNSVSTGAGVRQAQMESHAVIAEDLPLVKQALRWVGHAQTRNRGTVGGSLAYADPSAELPLVAMVLGAQIHIQSAREMRAVSAADFFLGPMFTEVGDTECITHIDWPVWSGGRVGSAFEETAIRQGDFAMASAACQIQLDAQGGITRLSLGAGGVAGTPLVFASLTDRWVGQILTPETAKDLAQAAARLCDPGSDMHAGAAYRTHLAGVLLERVLIQAAQQAALAAV
jgi:CO/xanthine dehydrogenase FAD-binding subunit